MNMGVTVDVHVVNMEIREQPCVSLGTLIASIETGSHIDLELISKSDWFAREFQYKYMPP